MGRTAAHGPHHSRVQRCSAQAVSAASVFLARMGVRPNQFAARKRVSRQVWSSYFAGAGFSAGGMLVRVGEVESRLPSLHLSSFFDPNTQPSPSRAKLLLTGVGLLRTAPLTVGCCTVRHGRCRQHSSFGTHGRASEPVCDAEKSLASSIYIHMGNITV